MTSGLSRLTERVDGLIEASYGAVRSHLKGRPDGKTVGKREYKLRVTVTKPRT